MERSVTPGGDTAGTAFQGDAGGALPVVSQGFTLNVIAIAAHGWVVAVCFCIAVRYGVAFGLSAFFTSHGIRAGGIQPYMVAAHHQQENA